MTLSHVNTYYQAARCARILQAAVRYSKLQDLAPSASSFYLRTRDSELWGAYNRVMRRVVWDLLNTPLPADHPTLKVGAARRELERILTGLRGVAATPVVDDATSMTGKLRILEEDSTDPLGDRCRSILGEEGIQRAVVLVRDRRFRGPVEDHFRQAGCPVPVAVPTELADLSVQEALLIVGQARFYDGSVLNAPRAERLWVVRYRWLRDIENAAGLLRSERTREDRTEPGTQRPRKPPPSDEFLVPRIDWEELRAQAAGRREDHGPATRQHLSGTEGYRARLYILAGGYAVYLESEGSSRVLRLDPEADGEDRVHLVSARALRSGSIVLLRRERGSGDFIEEIADRMLGSQAGPLRHAQQEWKNALRRKVYAIGAAAVERQLRYRGTRYQNVGYWMNPRSIRTRDRRDFRILMGYIGLRSSADRLWDQMGTIDTAHRKAGHLARSRLVDQVHGADLSLLDRVGYLDFQVEGGRAGTLTAYRIEGRAPGSDYVAEGLLHHPFEIAPDLWLE